MKEPTITIETSCGWTFKKKPSEMTNDQLHALLEENENDGNPKHLDAMRAELRRRETQK